MYFFFSSLRNQFGSYYKIALSGSYNEQTLRVCLGERREGEGCRAENTTRQPKPGQHSSPSLEGPPQHCQDACQIPSAINSSPRADAGYGSLLLQQQLWRDASPKQIVCAPLHFPLTGSTFYPKHYNQLPVTILDYWFSNAAPHSFPPPVTDTNT